jgi:hypothetical protein
MKKETLQAIRNTLNKLIPIISAYKNAFSASDNLLSAVQVTIQNMCFYWSKCNDYTHEQDVEKFNNYYKFLQELKDSSFTFHFIDFILDEVEMCIEGNMLSEYYDDMAEEEREFGIDNDSHDIEDYNDDFDIRTADLDNYEDERVYDEKESTTSLKKYRVYHPALGELNTFCELGIKFKEVANVFANSLGDAFRAGQNAFNSEYCTLGLRSTSVGDVIEFNGAYYMVMSTGFQRMYAINIV